MTRDEPPPAPVPVRLRLAPLVALLVSGATLVGLLSVALHGYHESAAMRMPHVEDPVGWSPRIWAALISTGLVALAGVLAAIVWFLRTRVVGMLLAEQRRAAEAAANHRALFARCPVAIIVSDRATGRVHDLNVAAEALYGWTAAEARGRTAVELGMVSAEVRRQALTDLARSGSAAVLSDVRRRDGSLRRVRATLATIVVDGREQLIGIIEDVTERERAASVLAESEGRLRTIIDEVGNGILLCDGDGRVLSANRIAAALFGVSADELIGRPLACTCAGEVFAETHRQTLESGGIELTCELRSGTAPGVPVEVHGRAIESGGQRLALLVLRDLGFQRAIDGALRFAAAQGGSDDRGFLGALPRFLVSQLGVDYALVAELDGDGRQAHALALHANGVDVPGLAFAIDGTPLADPDLGGLRLHRGGARALFPRDTLLQRLGADSVAVMPLLDPKRRPIGAMTVLHVGDLPQPEQVEAVLGVLAARAAHELGQRRHEAELVRQQARLEELVAARTAALRVAEQRLALAVRAGGIGIWEFVPGSGVDYVDERAADLLGLQASTPQRAFELWRERLHPDDQERVAARFEDHLAHGQPPYDVEYRYRHPEHGERRLHATGEVVARDTLGRPLRMVGYVEDVSEHARLRDELREAKETAETANRSKTRFLASVSHEIRTPLNAVLGYAQLLARDSALPPTATERVLRILDGGEHLLALINDVLEIARIEAGRLELQPVDCDLHRLLDDLRGLFQMRAEQKGLSFAIHRDASLPQLARVDAGKVRQVLINMLGNACKFTAQGGVCLTAAAAPVEGADADAALVTIAVADTGPGIDAEAQRRLFEEFVRAGAASATAPGSGLGLALARRLARLLGGDIAVESQPGHGSTFAFSFPVALTVPASPDPANTSGARRRVRPAGDRAPAGERVLVVDDEPCNRDILAVLLEQAGFSARCVEDGAAALRAWSEWHPQLVLMDQVMPGDDGLEVARRLQTLPGGEAVPVVLVTANALEEHRREALDAGLIDAYVRKPYRTEELLGEIGRLLGVAVATGLPLRAAPAPAALDRARLDPALLADLRQAIDACRLYDVLGLLDRLAGQQPEAAAHLRALAEDYRYGELARLLGD